MKTINVLVLGIFLTGCQQLLNGQQQPVRSLKNNMYFTSCSGAVEDWASCNNKAQRTCQGDYSIIQKEESSTGNVRAITFQCNK